MISLFCERCHNSFDTEFLQVLCPSCRASQTVAIGLAPDKFEMVEHLNRLVGFSVKLGWDYEFKHPLLFLYDYPTKVKIKVDYSNSEFQGFNYLRPNSPPLSVYPTDVLDREQCDAELRNMIQVISKRSHA